MADRLGHRVVDVFKPCLVCMVSASVALKGGDHVMPLKAWLSGHLLPREEFFAPIALFNYPGAGSTLIG
ncbi:hypothetical protein C7H08_08180 [Marinobacter halophilus]|uniref:Uncharacterized protein n=1 Tax=Marinobacter halophilus TaxID=1323740 RepID=A0A2T1KGH0_9GAMM|nr:hypothetical protein C7H08_08180 [Marinobacter halophilus]